MGAATVPTLENSKVAAQIKELKELANSEQQQMIGVEESLEGYRAYLKVGVQKLYFTERETIEEAQWYAEQVKTTLINMGSDILDFAALNYNPVVSDNREDIVWFEDESAGYPSNEVVELWLNSEQAV